ncbi:MAG: hypothetical protein KKE76_13225 [Gammaproteobacteria bacterium]|nr:hypothetical protein [Gammaproteobacteria bacterium]
MLNRQDAMGAKIVGTTKAPSRQKLLRTSLLSAHPSFRRMPESSVINNLDSGMRRNDDEISDSSNNVLRFSWRLGALAVQNRFSWRSWRLGG